MSTSNRPLVITTIHPDAPAIDRFAALPGVRVLLVGDRATPPMASREGVDSIDIASQHALDFRIIEHLPEGHYARKNIGYLIAASSGAEVIAETDDDNLPYPGWSFPDFSCVRRCVSASTVANVYRLFTDALIWPRGFPLDEIRGEPPTHEAAGEPMPVAIWQGLADLDPDVDAIYRLTIGGEVRFDSQPDVALPSGTWCPFNSQNTAWQREMLPAMYLPSTVSMRFCDILRGYVAQRVAWAMGRHLGFTRATVYQERNAHDLMRDFDEEVEMHRAVRPTIAALEGVVDAADPAEMTRRCYDALERAGVVTPAERPRVDAWLADAGRVLAVTEPIAWTKRAS